MDEMFQKVQDHLLDKLPFVLYRKPNQKEITAYLQQEDTLFSVNDFTEKGFVMSSFDGANTFYIPEEKAKKIQWKCQESFIENVDKSVPFFESKEKEAFVSLVSKGVQAVNNKEFEKVVLSRNEIIAVENTSIFEIYESLVYSYPTAFVYCFYHPKIGTWLGATPELLLNVKEDVFNTISLAGTQKDVGAPTVFWQNKEIEEQQFVTDFIVSKLKNELEAVTVSKPYSIQAGSLWHIRTDISGRITPVTSFEKIIQVLHPTPAVCGLPKESSKKFILENETYDRQFYTGFLGELNCDVDSGQQNADLYVNLRCMQIKANEQDMVNKQNLKQVVLYMGCGVTKDSIPEKEWEESVNKSMTMKKVLQSLS
ncbi:isochorismate synthase [Flavobacterium sp. SOK18b]|uniref:chorismate-binding protein n=1 Tax=Flavobacterium sp. SOK18b TaxID=797900 RepID=UPI0015FE3CEA|nr:chorismate-binding protein [Flavobacterium sp. SOK18b]MBB1194869.1 isochorismate synthase [Flavobacterium sp. SOK18b]